MKVRKAKILAGAKMQKAPSSPGTQGTSGTYHQTRESVCPQAVPTAGNSGDEASAGPKLVPTVPGPSPLAQEAGSPGRQGMSPLSPLSPVDKGQFEHDIRRTREG